MEKQREKEGAHRTAHRQDDPNTHTHTHRVLTTRLARNSLPVTCRYETKKSSATVSTVSKEEKKNQKCSAV